MSDELVDRWQPVKEAIRALVVRSETSFSWFEKASPSLPLRLRRVLTAEAKRRHLRFLIQERLYHDFYCHGVASPEPPLPRNSSNVAKLRFMDNLSAANRGNGYWDPRWEIVSNEGAVMTVRRDGLTLRLPRAHCRDERGGRISIRFSKESMNRLPGFYLAYADTLLDPEPTDILVRLYWNLTPNGATSFVATTTAMLNRYGIAFHLKALADPEHYTRCDAAVVYFVKTDYPRIRSLLPTLYASMSPFLKDAAPAFTKRLAPGLALAEDPGENLSFGEHRCRLIADGLMRAFELRRRSVEERCATVAERFHEAGIDVGQPFLRRGSSDDYESFIIERPSSSRRVSQDTQALTAAEYLAIAECVGKNIVRDAIWSGERCTWIGATATKLDATRRPTYRALGPNVYDGTAGVALFLAELGSLTGDPAVRRTAMGAVRQALDRLDVLRAERRYGLYAGMLGALFCAARVGILLDDAGLVHQVAHALRTLTVDDSADTEWDLLSGAAGAVVALIMLDAMLGERRLIELATRFAEHLLRTAERPNIGNCWRDRGAPQALTGLSHGASGVAYALLELYAVAGDVRYRDTAERAFAYERHWFDRRAQNWPDFRVDDDEKRRRKAARRFATVWCHGAPGIALTRFHALEILGDDSSCKSEAAVSLETTRTAIHMALTRGVDDYCLCHGLMGNAEVLSAVTPVEMADALVAEVAEEGAEHFRRNGGWPCGVGGEQTPDLMLGMAGIGYFYLRRYRPSIPTVLLLRRDDYVRQRPILS